MLLMAFYLLLSFAVLFFVRRVCENMNAIKSSVVKLFNSVPEKIDSLFPVLNSVEEEFSSVPWKSEKSHDLILPYYFNNDKACTISSFPIANENITLDKVSKGKSAFENNRQSWSLLSSLEKVNKINLFIKEAKKFKNNAVHLLMLETAKNLFESEYEINRAFEYVEKSCEVFLKMESDYTFGKYRAYSKPSPLGLVLCSGPSNYPFFETWSILFPALLCGNSIIVKLPGIGSLVHFLFFSLFRKYFPEGVVDFVAGDFNETIIPALKSGSVDLFAYIGREEKVDMLLKELKEYSSLRTVLGLEAKNPAIVFSDADIDNAAKNIVFGALNFNGQRCAAIKIVFAHKSIKLKLVKKISELVSNLNIGLPWNDKPDITPLLSLKNADFVEYLLKDALNKNGLIVNDCGGFRNKTFIYPAVIENVEENMNICWEEQFGPLIPVVSFTDFDKVLNYLTFSKYSQQISVFQKFSSQTGDLFDILRKYSCRINVNSFCTRSPDTFPFAVKRHSGNFIFSIEETFKHFSVDSIVVTKDI